VEEQATVPWADLEVAAQWVEAAVEAVAAVVSLLPGEANLDGESTSVVGEVLWPVEGEETSERRV